MKKTFWAIGPALIVHRCMETLAKRGKNLDMLTFLMGPRGVGLSLITAHMVAMYGVRNHKYFDPNIFFDDDELRKQVELLIGAFIFTGQEKPEGNTKSFRKGSDEEVCNGRRNIGTYALCHIV